MEPRGAESCQIWEIQHLPKLIDKCPIRDRVEHRLRNHILKMEYTLLRIGVPKKYVVKSLRSIEYVLERISILRVL